MTKLNPYAVGLETDLPKEHKNHSWLYKNLIRKDVEQMEFLIKLKEKDDAQFTADRQTLQSANITEEIFTSLGGRVQQMANKYGSVIGAPHYDEDLDTELEIAQLEIQFEIGCLQKRIASAKEAFKQLTGEPFTPYVKKAVYKPSRKHLEKRKEELRKMVG